MSLQKRYDRACDLANIHFKSAGQYHGRFLTLRSEAAKLKKGHRDRMLCATAFWNWREAAAHAREHADLAEKISAEITKEEEEAAKQATLLELATPVSERLAQVAELIRKKNACGKSGTAHLPDITEAQEAALKETDTRQTIFETHNGFRFRIVPSFNRFGEPYYNLQCFHHGEWSGGGTACDTLKQAAKRAKENGALYDEWTRTAPKWKNAREPHACCSKCGESLPVAQLLEDGPNEYTCKPCDQANSITATERSMRNDQAEEFRLEMQTQSVIVGKQLNMLAVEHDPRQLELF